ncbi:MAG: hypothetical protein ACYCQI_02995 [Gammaproteobacteria bacterium]
MHQVTETQRVHIIRPCSNDEINQEPSKESYYTNISMETLLKNVVIATSEKGVRQSDQYCNTTAATLLAKLSVVAQGDKDGSHFLRTTLNDKNGPCLQRSNDNATSLASLLIIDCDKHINKNGAELEGAPDPLTISQILRSKNIGHVIFGTYSHYLGTKGNRYRILLVTNRPYSRKQLPSTLETIISIINSNLDGDLLVNANENGTWAQPWYYPRKPDGSTVDELNYTYLEGDGIDVIEPPNLPPTNHCRRAGSHSNKTGEISVIAAYNEQYSLAALLSRYGYKKICTSKEYEKWLSPDSTSGVAGITVKDNKLFSHHDSCIFNDGYWHDAFDLMRLSEGLDKNAATIKAAKCTRAPDGQTVDGYNKNLFKKRTAAPEQRGRNKTQIME